MRKGNAEVSHYDPAKKYFFITASVQEHGNIFGRVREGSVEYSSAGKAAIYEWLDIPSQFPDIILDHWVLMPDHLHAIVAVKSDYTIIPKGKHKRNDVIPIIEISISSVVNRYKESVRKWFMKNGSQTFSWKPGFYMNSIRDDKMLQSARDYILHNPEKHEKGKADVFAGLPD